MVGYELSAFIEGVSERVLPVKGVGLVDPFQLATQALHRLEQALYLHDTMLQLLFKGRELFPVLLPALFQFGDLPGRQDGRVVLERLDGLFLQVVVLLQLVQVVLLLLYLVLLLVEPSFHLGQLSLRPLHLYVQISVVSFFDLKV